MSELLNIEMGEKQIVCIGSSFNELTPVQKTLVLDDLSGWIEQERLKLAPLNVTVTFVPYG